MPASKSSLLSDLVLPLLRQLGGAGFTALEPTQTTEGDSGRVLPFARRLFYNAGGEDVYVRGGCLA